MADIAGKGNEVAEKWLEESIKAARSAMHYTDSADNCVSCGEEIPSARQLAYPGCTMCIDCASELEKRRF